MQQTTWEKEDRQPALQRLSPAQDQGEQRLAVNAFLTEHWGSTVMMVRGEQVDMSRLPGIFVEEQGQITALLTYRIQEERCEIISLDSVIGGRGVGTALIEEGSGHCAKAGWPHPAGHHHKRQLKCPALLSEAGLCACRPLSGIGRTGAQAKTADPGGGGVWHPLKYRNRAGKDDCKAG